jgi:hypothetical protein
MSALLLDVSGLETKAVMLALWQAASLRFFCLMTQQALDLDLLVPTAWHNPGQAQGIVPVALVDLQRKPRLGITGIDADHW